jgi:nitrogen regulatory protein PII
MRLIVALIRSEQLPAVQRALRSFNLLSMSLSEVLVRSKDEAYTLIYRSASIRVDLVPRWRLEIAVNDGDVAAAVKSISQAAFPDDTDPLQSGTILIRPLDSTCSRPGGRPALPAVC